MTFVTETTVPSSSSMIASFTYDPDVENLAIEFRNGSTYTYFNVPASIYRGLQNAGSQGSYFVRNIKGRFSYEQE